jgi:hypothetical protein
MGARVSLREETSIHVTVTAAKEAIVETSRLICILKKNTGQSVFPFDQL